MLISWVNFCNEQFVCRYDTQCTRVRFTVVVTLQRWTRSSLYPLLCLQRQVAKLGSALFYYWPLLRNNNMATNLRRCSWSYGGTGPSPGFSSSGGQKPEGAAKKQKGGPQFKNTVLDVCSNRCRGCIPPPDLERCWHDIWFHLKPSPKYFCTAHYLLKMLKFNFANN